MSNFIKIKAALCKSELDAILLLDEKNRRYATGFHSSAGMVLVTKSEAFFITDSRYIEAAQKKVTGATVGLATAQMRERDWLEQIIRDCGIENLGFEDDFVSFAEHGRLQGHIAAKLLPAQEIMTSLRRCKSADELEKIVKAQRIAERAFDEVLGILAVGMTERETAAELSYRMSRNGGEGDSFAPIVVAGKKSSRPHGMPDDNIIASGDFVTMDFGCVFDGFCSDMTRTVAIGSASDEMRNVYGVVLEAQLAGIAAAKPDVKASEVDGAARKIIANAGFGEYFGHSFGHGIGLDVHEAPSVAPNSEQLLPEGAVISAEPGVYLPGKFGVRIEDMLYLSGGGAQNLTKSKKALLII